MVHARLLAGAGRTGLHARLREYLPAPAADRLSAAAAARALTVDAGDPERAAALARALAAAGAAVEPAGTLVVLVATAAHLEAAAAAQPAFASEVRALAQALAAAGEARVLRLRNRTLDLRDEAAVMGILNVTPDSFYERVSGTEAAVARARTLASDGAAVIDIGGQSYAHWNPRIASDEEARRVVPVVSGLAGASLDAAFSIDTVRADVARAALAAGAHLINDCSGCADPELPGVVAEYGAGLVVMHLRGELNVRDPQAYRYRDAMAEIVDFLYERTQAARRAGVAADSIIVDPGLEFGKEPATDLEILERFSELTALGYPILLAASRKSFIGRIFDRPANELLVPSLAAAGLGIAAGARLLRVHDVAETVQFARMYAAAGPARRNAAAIAGRMPQTPAASGNSADVDPVEASACSRS